MWAGYQWVVRGVGYISGRGSVQTGWGLLFGPGGVGKKVGGGGLGGVIPLSTASPNKKETRIFDRVGPLFYCQTVIS